MDQNTGKPVVPQSLRDSHRPFRTIAMLRASGWSPLIFGFCFFALLYFVGAIPIAYDFIINDRPWDTTTQSALGLLINVAATSYTISMFFFLSIKMDETLKEIAASHAHNAEHLLTLIEATFSNRHPIALAAVVTAGMIYGLAMGFVDFNLETNEFDIGMPEYVTYYWVTFVLPFLWLTISYYGFQFAANAQHVGYLVRQFPSVDLFDLEPFHKFVSVGILQILLLVGAAAILPLQGILVRGVKVWDFAVAGCIVLLLIVHAFRHPIWDARQRIAEEKEKELSAITAQVRSYSSEKRAASPEFAALLAYRTAVMGVEALPLTSSNVARLILFAVIPPLTWAGAAVISYWVTDFMAGI